VVTAGEHVLLHPLLKALALARNRIPLAVEAIVTRVAAGGVRRMGATGTTLTALISQCGSTIALSGASRRSTCASTVTSRQRAPVPPRAPRR